MIFTDALQTIIMIVGATTLAIISKNKLLRKYYSMNISNSCCCKKKSRMNGYFSCRLYKSWWNFSVNLQIYFEAVPSHSDGLVINGTSVNTTHNFTDAIMSNITQQCGLPRPDAFHIFRDPVNSDLPWPGLIIRTTFISTWFWCCDQVMVKMTIVILSTFNFKSLRCL